MILLCSAMKTPLREIKKKLANNQDVGFSGFLKSNYFHIPSLEEIEAIHHPNEIKIRPLRWANKTKLGHNGETYISWHWYLPPQSSTRIFNSESDFLIFSGLAFGTSILFIAITIGTSAAFA